MTGDDGGTRLAALEELPATVDPEDALQFGGRRAVAGVAALDEDRADFLLEELGGSRVVRRGLRRSRLREESTQKQEEQGTHGGSSYP